jgi:hypothetical protein
MRVLLDENLPQKLRLYLPPHQVFTTEYQGWAGLSNGALVDAAEAEAFDVLVTADQGLNYQQNLIGRRISLVVLSTNKSSLVLASAEKILSAINGATPGSFSFVAILLD